ncbi:MAG: hypothetical protein KC560_15385 [Myxococcales bacterium]|nr:hypothetical protein [Myxococcales bacterium]
MRALRLVRSLARRGLPSFVSLLALAVAIVLVGAGTAARAQDDADAPSSDEEAAPDAGGGQDDFLRDDFLDRGTESDDFLSEDFLETAEEEAPPSGPYHWGFEVPVDILLLRPLAFLDSAVGLSLFGVTGATVAVPTAVESLVNLAIDGEWYWNNGDLAQAWQQTVLDPWEYTWRRPLGQLTSF